MNIVENKLRELHITLPACPTPVAAYLPAVQAGNFVFASGQTPIVDGELLYQGKLGRDLGIEEGYEAARLAAIRVIAELKSVVGDLDRIERIVKVTGYVNSAPDFGGQPKVIHGASELFRNVFGEKGEHARVAFGTGALPDNAAVEIDVIAYVKD